MENAQKLLTCYFQPKGQPVRTVMGLVDTGNTLPRSAARSVALAKELGVNSVEETDKKVNQEMDSKERAI